SAVATVLGTVAVNVVAGGAAPGTTVTGQTSLTAQLVWLAQTQTLSVVSTVATLLGTVAVNVVAGGAAPGTTVTGQTSLTAQLVWLAQTQTLSVVSTVATLLGTVAVTDARFLFTPPAGSGPPRPTFLAGGGHTLLTSTTAGTAILAPAG